MPLASFELSLLPRAIPMQAALPDWLPADWAANSSAHGLVALGLLNDARPDAACEFSLGAQTLRLQRTTTAGAC